MTDTEVSDAYNRVWVDFWKKYNNDPPKENTPGWKEYHDFRNKLTNKYPLLEEVIRRMDAEIMERARGRGNAPGDFHRPPT